VLGLDRIAEEPHRRAPGRRASRSISRDACARPQPGGCAELDVEPTCLPAEGRPSNSDSSCASADEQFVDALGPDGAVAVTSSTASAARKTSANPARAANGTAGWAQAALSPRIVTHVPSDRPGRATLKPFSGAGNRVVRRLAGIFGERAHQIAIPVSYPREAGVDLASPAALADLASSPRAACAPTRMHRRRSGCRARRCCRRSCPTSPDARRMSCCRSSRRWCTTGVWPVRRTSASTFGLVAGRSRTTPGCTRACRRPGSMARMLWQCLGVERPPRCRHCPARLVPAPRETPARRHAARRHGRDHVVRIPWIHRSAPADSWTSRGVEARLPASNCTSPFTRSRSRDSRARTTPPSARKGAGAADAAGCVAMVTRRGLRAGPRAGEAVSAYQRVVYSIGWPAGTCRRRKAPARGVYRALLPLLL
jgi:hypothetical protein